MKKRLPGNMAFLMALMVLLNISCTEIVDIDLDSTYTRLVVQGGVTSDSAQHQVRLTLSSDYFSNQPAPGVSNAVVHIDFDNTSLLLEEHDTIPGLYLTPYAFRGEIGTSYDLSIDEVDVDNDGIYESYNASSTMPGVLSLTPFF